jgi:hypothetical protein
MKPWGDKFANAHAQGEHATHLARKFGGANFKLQGFLAFTGACLSHFSLFERVGMLFS